LPIQIIEAMCYLGDRAASELACFIHVRSE